MSLLAQLNCAFRAAGNPSSIGRRDAAGTRRRGRLRYSQGKDPLRCGVCDPGFGGGLRIGGSECRLSDRLEVRVRVLRHCNQSLNGVGPLQQSKVALILIFRLRCRVLSFLLEVDSKTTSASFNFHSLALLANDQLFSPTDLVIIIQPSTAHKFLQNHQALLSDVLSRSPEGDSVGKVRKGHVPCLEGCQFVLVRINKHPDEPQRIWIRR